MTSNNTTSKAVSLYLGYINADKIRKIIEEAGYSSIENENGYFTVQGDENVGVVIYTNCFESKKHLKKYFFNLLLVNL